MPNILVIDDDKSILAVFEFIINESGHGVLTADSGEAGLQKLATHGPIDLVFLDIKMGGISGIETLRNIVSRYQIPVILMTGYSMDEILEEAFKIGAFGVIYKPFDMDEIFAAIGRAIKKDFALRRS